MLELEPGSDRESEVESVSELGAYAGVGSGVGTGVKDRTHISDDADVRTFISGRSLGGRSEPGSERGSEGE